MFHQKYWLFARFWMHLAEQEGSIHILAFLPLFTDVPNRGGATQNTAEVGILPCGVKQGNEQPNGWTEQGVDTSVRLSVAEKRVRFILHLSWDRQWKGENKPHTIYFLSWYCTDCGTYGYFISLKRYIYKSKFKSNLFWTWSCIFWFWKEKKTWIF